MTCVPEAIRMSSFYFRAVGCLARNPELVVTEVGSYYRFCLTSQDYSEDEQGRFTVVTQSLGFVATNLTGALIAQGAGKGDQLFIEGKIRKHHWTAKGDPNPTFVVTGFQFGARRHPGSPAASTANPPPKIPSQPKEGAVTTRGQWALPA
jgi:single-stranded DNA-binding protein